MSSATVTALALHGIEKYYGREGIDVIQIAERHTLPKALWNNLAQDIPLKEFVAFFEDLGKQSIAPEQLWLAGYHYDISRLGCLGKLIDESPTLGDAMLALRDFFCLAQSDAYLSIRIEEQLTTIAYKILDLNIWPRRRDAEFTLGMFQGIIHRYVQDQCYPLHIDLEDYSEASQQLAHALHFPCRAGRSFNRLSFPTALLDYRKRPTTAFAQHHYTCLRTEMQKQLTEKKRQTPTYKQVRRNILTNIGNQPISQDLIACELGVSRRTLRRKLADEHCSFQQVLESCRMLTAEIDLQYSQMPLTDIALKLGFSEQSAFTRAFTRWCGQTPNEYRRYRQGIKEHPDG